MILSFLQAMVWKETTDYNTCYCGHGQAVECKQLKQTKPIWFDKQSCILTISRVLYQALFQICSYVMCSEKGDHLGLYL